MSKEHNSTEDVLKGGDEKLFERSENATDLHGRPKASIFGLLKDGRILSITLMATIGGFLFGYDQGVVGNVLVLERFGSDFPRFFADENIKGWFVSSLLLGAWFGSLISGPIVDRLGRKRSIMAQNVLFLLGSALQTGATKEAHHFAGRVLAGVAIGGLTHVVPMYIAELAPSSIRGSLVALQQLAITLGILFSYWIAFGTSHIGGTRCAPEIPYTGPIQNGRATFDPYTDVPAGGCTGQSEAAWRIPVGLQMLPSLILQAGMFFMPFSPRWLVEKNRDEEAKKTLSYLRRRPEDDNDVMIEYLEIKAEVLAVREIEAARNDKATTKMGRFIRPYRDLVSSKSNAKRLFIGSVVMFYQQFIGCNAIIYYAPTIFASLGLDPNTTSLLATGVYGIVNTVFTLPAVLFLDRVGRRPLLMAGAVGCFFSLIMVGSMIAAYGGTFDVNPMPGHVAIAFVYIYDVFFSFSWAPIGWVLPSEIFNLSTRSTGVSITTSCTWMSNFIIGLVSPIMLANLDHGGTYFFFAAFAIFGFFTVYFFIPETRLRTLEEMDEVFGAEQSNEERQTVDHVRRQLGLPTSTSQSV